MEKLKASLLTTALKPDPVLNNVPRQVPDAAYSLVEPIIFKNREIIHVTLEVAKYLGFTEEYLELEEFKKMVTGGWVDSKNPSFAMNYGGHQFGQWAGQLGDGRAINIGQIEIDDASQQLQLKGAGPTPYSRRGDGYAVLRSSIREHLCSEAMHHLGIPTTRSLSLALTGEQVMRDAFYDGNAAYEKGAVVCRVAPSFLRFGNFQLPSANGNDSLLRQITDFTIKHHFPQIKSEGKEKYLEFFKEVSESTLELMIHWQRVGFVHGVMNTDNMSILGLTIDYGPYGWIDDYDPDWTPNTTDNQHKRYRYSAQPEIGLWNLWQLANALFSLIDDSKPLEAILNDYKTQFVKKHLEMMRCKLGLTVPHDSDVDIIADLMELLPKVEVDMTLFFRELARLNSTINDADAFEILSVAFYDLDNLSINESKEWQDWISVYIIRLKQESAYAIKRVELMNSTNPKYVLRNYMAQLIINDAEKGDYTLLEQIHEMLKDPYKEQPNNDKWYAKRPDWARNKPGSSQLSCSS
ncbi:protein adenylyltransferase SelO [Nonlabens antarcticus]|uniref:protein adenylyltransferase SelO n=1 Tax=Nonlabens antarcticus TaxID=392714 RepID=UPI0018913BCE|nr:YdiU family protein [Nonlabens antarcticus]